MEQKIEITDEEKITLLSEEIAELYNFIQYVEAKTICSETSNKIRSFLQSKGIWQTN
jgi:hypothetical protein